MKDAECPYCGTWQNINHDDGYGYEEGEKYNQTCVLCGKVFVYETSVTYYYDTKKADCLNGGEHILKATCTYPREFTKMRCQTCGEERCLTESEFEQLMKGELK